MAPKVVDRETECVLWPWRSRPPSRAADRQAASAAVPQTVTPADPEAAATSRRMTRALRAGRSRPPTCRRLPAQRAAGARQAGRGGEGVRRAVPAAGLGGNETMLLDAGSQTRRTLGRARLHYFLLNKGPWSRLDHNEPFVPGAPPKPPQAQLLSRRAPRRRRSRRGSKTLPAAERTRATGFFTTIRRGPDGRFMAVPYSLEYQGELAQVAALLREAAALTQQPTLKAFLEKRAAALLSNDYYDSDVAWMELDATHRADHRSVRGLRGRVVQLQGGVRGVHHAARRRRDAEAGAVRRRAAGDREQPADRPEVPQPEARRAGAHPRGQHRVLVRRRQPRRADGGLQPAERRARDRREGRQARDAEEQPGGQVPHGAAADLEGGAVGGRPGERVVRRVLHPHPDARADARPRPAQHHRRRPRDDRAAGAEGAPTARSRRRRPTSRACSRCSSSSIAASSTRRSSRRCTRRTWRRCSARSASASTRRTAAASRMQLNYFLDNGGVTVAPDGTFAVNARAHQAERHRPDARHHDACRRWATTPPPSR